MLKETVFPVIDQLPDGVRLSPEVLVPRLGESLVEKGLLSEKDLERALAHQAERAASGNPCLLGQALIELGLIDRATLDEVIAAQIYLLQTEIHRINQELEGRVQARTAELQSALMKLTELNQLKSNFIAGISHELRTPLTHIKGYLDLFSDLSLGPLTPMQLKALEVLKRSEARLETLIEDLIHFSLADRGELAINLQPISIKYQVVSAIKRCIERAANKGVTVITELPDDLPPVQADQEKIMWVLGHLLDNAIKFTPAGGRIVIAADIDQDQMWIRIKDTGIGIPQDRVEEIFQPFHQLDGSMTRRYSGIGLGLSLVKSILDAHGSPIEVESTVGSGTTVSFSLKIA